MEKKNKRKEKEKERKKAEKFSADEKTANIKDRIINCVYPVILIILFWLLLFIGARQDEKPSLCESPQCITLAFELVSSERPTSGGYQKYFRVHIRIHQFPSATIFIKLLVESTNIIRHWISTGMPRKRKLSRELLEVNFPTFLKFAVLGLIRNYWKNSEFLRRNESSITSKFEPAIRLMFGKCNKFSQVFISN